MVGDGCLYPSALRTSKGKHAAWPFMKRAAYSDSVADAHTDSEICLQIVSWGSIDIPLCQAGIRGSSP